jgi:hypothetical protein
VFKASDIRWASRWDTYLIATDDQVHWFSIVNSLMIVLFLRWVRAAGVGVGWVLLVGVVAGAGQCCCWWRSKGWG